MTFLKQWISKFLIVSMTLSSLLATLIPTAAHAASSSTTSVSTGTVGTAITPTFTYILDTTQQTWADSDTLTFTNSAHFPAWSALTYTVEFDIDNIDNGGSAETALTAGAGVGQYSVSGQTLTVSWNATTWADVTGSAVRVIVTGGFVPQYFGGSAKCSVATSTISGIDSVYANDLTITLSAAAAAASFALTTNSAVGAAGSLTTTLTLPLDLASGATVILTLPNNIDVSQAAFTSESFLGAGTISGCTVSDQIITCTAGGAITAGTGNIVVSGVKSWFAATSKTGTCMVKDASANFQATTMSTATTDTTVGALTAAGISLQTYVAENTGTATISLTSTVTSTLAIPSNGKIVVTFPSEYVLSGASGATGSSLSGVNGTWTATVSGQILTLTQSGGTTSTAGAVSITIPGIKNPRTINSAGTFTVATKTPTDSAVQTGTTASVAIIGLTFNNFVRPIDTTPAVVTPVPAITTTTLVISPVPAVIPAPAITTPAPAVTDSTKDLVAGLQTGRFDRAIALKLVSNIAADLNLPSATPSAAKCEGNSLIKVGGNSAVYYCGTDGKRYVFPSSQVFKTWFPNYDGIKTLSAEDMASIALGGNVKYRPGVTMIKIQTDPRVYVVAPGGVLRWVASEAIAVKLYGSDWNKQIQDVSDSFFVNYTVGGTINE